MPRKRVWPPERRVWDRIQQRCHNPRHMKFPGYGGRGITVCERWRGPGGFDRFLADMGPRPSVQHSIERLDNNGPYSPDNCCWATDREQRRNRRCTTQIWFEGELQPLADVCAVLGLDQSMVYGRLRMGWSDERALTQPVRPKRKNGTCVQVVE